MKIKKGDIVAVISGEYAPEKGQPYKTGEVIKIAASKRPVFTASKVLKDEVNG